MSNNILPISWADAPEDPAGEALYRINQLENATLTMSIKATFVKSF